MMCNHTAVALIAFIAAHVALIFCTVTMSTHYWMVATPPKTNATDNTTVNSYSITYSKGLWRFCFENKTTKYDVNNVTESKRKGLFDVNEFGTVIMNNLNESFIAMIKPHVHKEVVCFRLDTYNNYTGIPTPKNELSNVMFKITQITYTFGYGMLCVATFLLYVFVCVSKARTSTCLATTITILSFSAAGMFLVGLVITGQHYKDDIDFHHKYFKDYKLGLSWSFYSGMAGNVVTFICAISCIYNLVIVKSTIIPYHVLPPPPPVNI